MKQIIKISIYSIYCFIVFGLLMHTSSHPQLFGKYTYIYFVILLFIALSIFPILSLIDFLFKKTTIKLKNKKYTLKPKRKLIILLLVVVFIVAPVELYLRNKFRDFESVNYRYTLENFNPYLQSQLSKHENIGVNSLGFRGEEIDFKKPKDTYRIVIFGGSTVLNREVTFEKNAARLLEKKLRNTYPERRIEVINAGKDFYSSQHSLIQYLFKVDDMEPDLILMWHGINDMGMSCPNEGVISHGEFKPDYSNMYGAVSNIIFDYFRPQPLIKMELVTLDFATRALSDNLFSDLTQKYSENSRKNAAIQYMNKINTIRVYNFPSVNSYSRNIQMFVDYSRLRNIPLVLGNQPSLIKEKNNLQEVEAIMTPTLACRRNGKFYDLESLGYGIKLFNNTTQKIALKNGVDFIDLHSLVPQSLSYFTDQVHFTEKGNEVIANALHTFLTKNNYIKIHE